MSSTERPTGRRFSEYDRSTSASPVPTDEQRKAVKAVDVQEPQKGPVAHGHPQTHGRLKILDKPRDKELPRLADIASLVLQLATLPSTGEDAPHVAQAMLYELKSLQIYVHSKQTKHDPVYDNALLVLLGGKNDGSSLSKALEAFISAIDAKSPNPKQAEAYIREHACVGWALLSASQGTRERVMAAATSDKKAEVLDQILDSMHNAQTAKPGTDEYEHASAQLTSALANWCTTFKGRDAAGMMAERLQRLAPGTTQYSTIQDACVGFMNACVVKHSEASVGLGQKMFGNADRRDAIAEAVLDPALKERQFMWDTGPGVDELSRPERHPDWDTTADP